MWTVGMQTHWHAMHVPMLHMSRVRLPTHPLHNMPAVNSALRSDSSQYISKCRNPQSVDGCNRVHRASFVTHNPCTHTHTHTSTSAQRILGRYL
mmetsp:Transcript_37533/g.75066  ORF Transcript_37533/g.75066 Transcript_37533/m.75066 type:complete len:94 (-) Transcript_37533:1760-2041(-)